MAAVLSRHPTINRKSAVALGEMIEGRRAERRARERALMYRLGATNKVTKGKKQKNRRGLKWPPISKKSHNNQPKTAAATEGTMEGRRDEREARGKRNTIVLGGD